jgi:50S ribosomal protein L16 3-hydroxylase
MRTDRSSELRETADLRPLRMRRSSAEMPQPPADAAPPPAPDLRLLHEWIAPLELDAFTATRLGRIAHASPGTASNALAMLDWEVLGRVLAADPGPDTIVCARGRALSLPAPRELVELRAYMRMGIGLCLRQTQRCDPGLGRVAADFTTTLSRPAHVQVFVTPGGTHGFGWHYDLEDVFIVQTAGVKDYYFRANTVEHDTPFPPRDFNGYHAETSVLQTATLVPGDFLYIPSRWWHMAVCRKDALSISVGVAPA